MRDILIVDDSKTSLKMMKRALENDYKIYSANSAELALEMLERKLIDLVLMDINNMLEIVKYESCYLSIRHSF